MTKKACVVSDCGRPRYAIGLCEAHYRRKRRTGDVQSTRSIGEWPEQRCAVADCDRTAAERGWCHGHYLRWVRLGDVQADRPLDRRVNTTCTVETCDRQATERGLCKTHANRKRKYGDVQADKPIREIAGTGYISHGYRVIPVHPSERWLVNGDTKSAEHRLVMAKVLGRPLFPDESVHHVDGDRLNNDPSNLELWSRWQPAGQRVTDKVAAAIALLQRYAPQLLHLEADLNGRLL